MGCFIGETQTAADGEARSQSVCPLLLFRSPSARMRQAGAVSCSGTLRSYAALEKDVILIGVSNRVEVWSRVAWEAYNEKIDPVVTEIAETLVDLGI